MLRHFTIARIKKCHVSVRNTGLSDVGTISNVIFWSQEICVRCRDMSGCQQRPYIRETMHSALNL